MKSTIIASLFLLISAVSATGKPADKQDITPDGTYMFMQRDTCDLYLDIYDPAPGSETIYNGKRKPTILFVFGGGFISGNRAEPFHLPWYRELTDTAADLSDMQLRQVWLVFWIQLWLEWRMSFP